MKTLSQWLRDGDPAGAGAGLTESQAERMRRVVIATTRESPVERIAWRQPLAVAAVVVVTVVVGIATGRQLPSRDVVVAPADMVTGAGGERRQLQFSTPGGTRIIWVFDPDFQLKETMP